MLRIVEANAGCAACNSTASRPQIAPTAPSPLLSRLSAFIPQLQAANDCLQGDVRSETATGLDIEVIPQVAESLSTDGSESDSDASEAPDDRTFQPSRPHIEMDIACGVLDLKDAAACEAAEAAAGNGHSLDDAADTAGVQQKGLVLPSGNVLSLPPASPRATSTSEDDGREEDILEVSTTRFHSVAVPGQQDAPAEAASECELSENVCSPARADSAVKKQKIVML